MNVVAETDDASLHHASGLFAADKAFFMHLGGASGWAPFASSLESLALEAMRRQPRNSSSMAVASGATAFGAGYDPEMKFYGGEER